MTPEDIRKLWMEVEKEEALARYLKNEEKLWDLAALTIAPTVYQIADPYLGETRVSKSARVAYDLADALMKERRKRLGFKSEETT